ncbi:hypothetical protein HPSA_04925 [Helicobacter pylori SouthAfrica7]|uniref:Uncharacterized protein n=1 Tax=Helicobacter pylori (strain SouthAfrica7) TaxID=907239 RepID=E8QSJ8_HELPW|nr:hypothetical protein HPSA_04925 [Helicobacter pylori SouthAfrica7]
MELISADSYELVWAKFTEITFSVLKDLPQSLTKIKR